MIYFIIFLFFGSSRINHDGDSSNPTNNLKNRYPKLSEKKHKYPAAEITGTCGNKVSYTIDKISKKVTINGTGAMTDYITTNSPFTTNKEYIYYLDVEKGVTTIGYGSFKDCVSLISINLSNSVQKINQDAFRRTNISSIILPKSVTSIGIQSFDCCYSLQSVIISGELESISHDCFYYCTSLSYFAYKGRKEPYYKGSRIFLGCSQLKSITVSYNYIDNIFCEKEVSRLPSDVTEYTGKCGEDLTYNFNVDTCVLIISGSGMMTNFDSDNSSFLDFPYTVKTINFGAGITSVGDYAFQYFRSLPTIELPSSITYIGYHAFYGCSNLLSVKIIDGITSILNHTFSKCFSLTKVELPETIQIIHNYAFSGCNSLKEINLPNSLTQILYGAFNFCKSLESINIPNSVEIIDGSAFGSCSSLLSFTIPFGITKIEERTFQVCSSLTHIDIPNTVTAIGELAFSECRSLISIDLPKSIRLFEYSAFSFCLNLTSIIIPYCVTLIPSYAFRSCFSLTQVHLPSTVTLISEYSFNSCQSLVSINLPNRIRTIGARAFQNCVSLSSIIIPERVTYINEYLFSNCTSLKSVIITSNLSSIYKYAFDKCKSLSYFLYAGYKVPNVETNAFYNNNLTSIDVLDYYNSTTFGSFNINKNQVMPPIKTSPIIDDDITSCEDEVPSSTQSTSNDGEINSSETSNINDDNDVSESQSSSSLMPEDPTTDLIISGECNENAPSGCLFCNISDQSQCIKCDKNKLFDEVVDRDGKCKCIDNYELNQVNQCVPELGKCEQHTLDGGCSLCYLYDRNICAECDIYRGFKKDPNINNECECINPDFNISQNVCVELHVKCIWGNGEPVLGCILCHGHRTNQCTVCDESKGFIINNSTHKCQCKQDGYEVNSQGECVPPSESHCDEKEMTGCIKCSDNDDHKCISCDSLKGFILDSNLCKCEVDGYEINSEGICIPPTETLCQQDALLNGCIKCSLNDAQKCSLCDTSLNFNKDPNSKGICTCKSDFTLNVNGECFEYIQEDPVLSFNEYTGTKEIPTDCIILDKTSLTIDTSNMKNNDLKLYETTIETTINEVKIDKNTLNNVQLSINGRENEELNVQVEEDQKIQLDVSNSHFPINLPSKSQEVTIKVESFDSSLEIKSKYSNVNLGNISVSKNSFVLKPNTNVVVEYINLFGESKISSTSNNDNNDNKAKLTAKKVNVQRGSESQISNVLISEQLNLAPNSVVLINKDVDFTNAQFSIYKTSSQRMNYTYFKFDQKITRYPKGIEIKEIEDNIFLNGKEDKIIIIHQIESIFSEEMCKKWAEKVNGYKGFCLKNDPNNDGHNSVYAVKSLDDPNEGGDGKDGDGKDGDGKDGLNGGIIAGIVIGCIAVIAIVIILIYFFVIKKKKQSYSSDKEDENNLNEDI